MSSSQTPQVTPTLLFSLDVVPPSTGPLGCRRVSFGSNRFHHTEQGGELTIFVGDDWAEDHVRHEASEIEWR